MECRHVFLAILVVFASVVQMNCEMTAKCYMEPNKAPPSNVKTSVTGMVTLSQESLLSRTKLVIHLKGLKPDSVHGFHVHEYGDIISNGCQSAGGHYNPFGVHHGGPHDIIRHVGDLGNVNSDGDGRIKLAFFDRMVSLYGTRSVIGRSIVIHAKEDDLGRGTGAARKESLKTGNAGARLGCCTIVYAA